MVSTYDESLIHVRGGARSASTLDDQALLARPIMWLFILKAVVSGLIVAAVSTIARRYPGWGGLVASLPLVSVMAMLWLYGETRESEKVAALAMSTFWFFLPSMPLFLIIPLMIRSGWSFGVTMVTAVVVTMALYAGMNWLAPKLGIVL